MLGSKIRRGGRAAEGDGLLNRYTDFGLYRGFESLPLRFSTAPARAGVCCFVGSRIEGRLARLLSGRMAPGLMQRQRHDEALATLASLIGALVLARAVNDAKLSDDILRATRKKLET